MTKALMARLDRLLANLGYGARREVQALVAAGKVTFDGVPLKDAGKRIAVTADLPQHLFVRGAPIDPPAPQTVRAVVSDAHGNPAAGVSVVFSTKTGTLAPTRAHTDSAGRAQTRWTLSPRAGDQVLEAVVKEGGARGVAHVRGIRSRRGS